MKVKPWPRRGTWKYRWGYVWHRTPDGRVVIHDIGILGDGEVRRVFWWP
jgi:hypothetical protein